MPAQPVWFQRLDDIIADLKAIGKVVYLDRQAIEKIFRVRDRRARTLMAGFEGIQVGNAWVVDRLKLIKALERIRRGDQFQWEQQRRRRVAAVYDQVKREHPARQVVIPVTRTAQERTLASLPPGVHLSTGELHMTFNGFEEFLSKLYQLGQAVQNDFQSFRECLGDDQFTG